jgi:hypothetical protein
VDQGVGVGTPHPEAPQRRPIESRVVLLEFFGLGNRPGCATLEQEPADGVTASEWSHWLDSPRRNVRVIG